MPDFDLLIEHLDALCVDNEVQIVSGAFIWETDGVPSVGELDYNLKTDEYKFSGGHLDGFAMKQSTAETLMIGGLL